MDKETLVGSDIEVEGHVLDALSHARIPVTLCVWNYVPQLEEWQLVIATPWVDTRGPHEANHRILEALNSAGVYQRVPIRRLFVLSPRDPIVRALEREVKLKTEGTIHIIRENHTHPTQGARYSVIFAPFVGPGGAIPSKAIFGPQQLREFLDSKLGISSAFVEYAIDQLQRNGTASIAHVRLTNREARKLGLA